METNSSGDELLKTSREETNCLETKSRGTLINNAGKNSYGGSFVSK